MMDLGRFQPIDLRQLARPGRQYPDEAEREEFARARSWINVHTRQLDDGVGLLVESGRLNDDERRELLRLTAQISAGEKVGTRALARWERLVETASGREPGSVFASTKEAVHTAQGFRQLTALAAKKRRPRAEQEDAVVIPAGVTRAVRDGKLDGVDLLVIYRLLAAQAGVLGPGDVVKDGAVTDYSGAFLSALDPDGMVAGVQFSLKERLWPGGWITYRQVGNNKVAVGPGPRLLAALKERDEA
jgi:hypothetical protein